MIAPDGRETARGASEYARLNIARVKSPGRRSKAACAPRFSGAQELPKRRCACALFPSGPVDCRVVRHARQSPSLSAHAREVFARRERAEGRAQSPIVRSGRSGGVSGPPRPRIVAATRGDRGAPGRKKNIRSRSGTRSALWRSDSREPRLHARALGERVIGELTPSGRPAREISGDIGALEKLLERWRRRGRARRRRAGLRGARGRARGRAENTERREICREPIGAGNAAHLPQENPKLASSRQSRSRQAIPLPSRPYAAVSTRARDPSPSPLRALLEVTKGHRRSGATFGSERCHSVC